MKKIFGNIQVLLVVFIIFISVIPIQSFAERNTNETEPALKYELKTDALTGENYAVITGGVPVKNLVIPSTIDGYTVREVGSGFAASDKEWKSTIETVIIEEGIEAIGASAFLHCTALKEVSFPESLNSIDELAFADIGAENLTIPANAEKDSSGMWYCSRIRKDEKGEWEYGILSDGTAVITSLFIQFNNVTIPEKIDGLQVSAVARIPLEKVNYLAIHAIKTIKLPKGLKMLEHEAFQGCTNIKKIDIPKTVELIGNAVFKGCTQLKSINIPTGVTRIGEEAFSECTNLFFPALPTGLEVIGQRTFYQCRSLGKVKLPATIREVGQQAFGYSRITVLMLNEGLETIGKEAFLAHMLKEIVFPESLKIIGDAAFDPNSNNTLKKITFNGKDTRLGIGVFGYDNGWDAYRKKGKKEFKEAESGEYNKNDPKNWIDYYSNEGNYGQNILSITCFPGSQADQIYQYHVIKKYHKRNTDKVTAPNDRVLYAGLYTNEDEIYELIVPDGVEVIDDYALAGLATLTKVTLPSTLGRIGAHAFEQCTGLTEIVFRNKELSEIDEAAFYGCTQLKSIIIPEGIKQIRKSTFEGCTNLSKITLPKKGLLSIDDKAFARCQSLTSISLPTGLLSIGTETFSRCGISNMTVPDSVSFIGKKAFYYSAVKSLKLPAEMDEIPEFLCAYSTKLNNVTMPKKIKRVGDGAFMWCPVKNITLPEGLESIGERAFAFDMELATPGRKTTMSKMTVITIPASLKIIEKEAFAANDALKKITIKNGSLLEKIGENAFAMCLNLSGIELPDSLHVIENGAFKRCEKMTKVNLGGGVEKLGDEVFLFCTRMTNLTATGSLKTIGKDLLKNHGSKLKVTCPETSEMHKYMAEFYPRISLIFSK